MTNFEKGLQNERSLKKVSLTHNVLPLNTNITAKYVIVIDIVRNNATFLKKLPSFNPENPFLTTFSGWLPISCPEEGNKRFLQHYLR